MNAPIVLKIIPPKKRGPDAAHARYIATSRESGVVLRDDTLHASYIHQRSGSHGLFSRDDTQPDLQTVERQLAEKEGPSWAMVISVREDDALQLELTHDQWVAATRRFMVDAANVLSPVGAGRLHWVAAHHEKDGHPHVHILAWLDQPDRKQLLTRTELKQLRRPLVKTIAENAYARDVAEKTALRDLAVLAGKRNLAEVTRTVADAEREIAAKLGTSTRIPPVFPREDLFALSGLIRQVRLPGHGRAMLAYMPDDTKRQLREIADWMLTRPSFEPVLSNYEHAVRSVNSYYTQKTDTPAQKALDDLRDRVAQQVLRAAVSLDRVERLTTWDRQNTCNRVFRSVFRILDSERERAEAQAYLASRRLAERQDYGARERV